MAHKIIGGYRPNVAAIHGFLALNTKRSPRNGKQPLWVNWLFAVFAHPEGAFTEAVQGRAYLAQLFGFAIDMTDRERAFGGALDFLQLIRALLNRNAVA